jgi:hypothetical protein
MFSANAVRALHPGNLMMGSMRVALPAAGGQSVTRSAPKHSQR